MTRDAHTAGTEPEDSRAATSNQLTDPLALRALAHPLRIKLLGMIGVNGTLTATQAATGLKITPAASSYHLRTLAKYGFIEDAGATTWRDRPWRLTDAGASFSWDSGADDPASRALTRVIYAEWLEHIQRYQAHQNGYPADVRQASGGSEIVLFATAQEMIQVRQRLMEILAPFHQRIDPAHRPNGAVPMEVIVFSHPLLPPDETAEIEPDGVS